MSPVSSCAEQISPACASILRERVSPPCGFGAKEPVRRRSLSQRIAVEGAIPNRVAAVIDEPTFADAILDRVVHNAYLPPYSPDLNPIEMAFAKPRALLGKAAERADEALCERIGKLRETFAQKGCSNCLTHAGDDRT